VSPKLRIPAIFALPEEDRALGFDAKEKPASPRKAPEVPWHRGEEALRPDAFLNLLPVFFRGFESPRRFYRKLSLALSLDLEASFFLGSDRGALEAASLFGARSAFFPKDPERPPGIKEFLSKGAIPSICAPSLQGALDWAAALQR
jgi:hypothetical protein